MSSLKQYTVEEVSKHNSINDCWIIINNRVFDITNFIRSHPGGAKILLGSAGEDCTAGYLAVHSEAYLSTFVANSFIGIIAGSNQTPLPKPKNKNLTVLDKPFDSNNILSIKRDLYTAEHEQFRSKFADCLSRVVLPKYSKFEQAGIPDKETFTQLFDEGFYLKYMIPKEFGGGGIKDWRYSAIVAEELENCDVGGLFVNLGNDMVLTYFTKQMTKPQQEIWLPYIMKNKPVIAIAMSEPELGSDLGSLSCTAIKSSDGSNNWILNGRKMWISAGATCDLVIVACVTDPKKKYRGISLFVVERGMKGFETAKRFNKLGKHPSDTCLITLDNVVVTQNHLVGKEGEGFLYMMDNLAKERLSIAVGSVASARKSLALTLNYVHGREAFNGNLAGLQAIQYDLSKLRIEIQSATVFVDKCVMNMVQNQLTTESASMAKYLATELSNNVANICLQFFGGYGYLKESPIGKAFVDQRVTKIYGGSNQVMLEIVGKGMGFKPQRFVSKL